MKKWWLEITLHSDLCVATGDSEQGAAHIKTALEYGIPWIPAKRLKGSLLNEGREMVSNGFVKKWMLERLFGAPGGRCPAVLHIEDAHLYKIPGALLKLPQDKGDVVLKAYNQELENLKSHPDLGEELAECLLTRSRTRTALDKETGTAQNGTLRTIQIVPRGMVFRSMVVLRETEDSGLVEVLEWCVKALRHIGLGITRGYGEVSCALKKFYSDEDGMGSVWQENKKTSGRDSFQNGQSDGESGRAGLRYEIELLDPALFAGKKGLYEDCCNYIPGAAIMGAMAAMYIEDHQLGRCAHADENFRRIFLRDGVQFGNGFLQKEERTFYPCPAFLAVKKENDGEFINRLMADQETVRRREISSQVCLNWKKGSIGIRRADVEKEVRMHHARPVDRGIGHAVNDRIQAGAVDMGQFFQYMCLSKGQRFSGVIKGKREDIQALLQCLEKRQYRLSLGRSRTAEYGQAKVVRCAYLPEERTCASQQWLLWLLSPLVFKDCGNYMADSELKSWETQMTERLRCKVRLTAEERKNILKYTKVGGYHSVWKLPLPQYMALAPGSVVYMEAEKALCAADLEKNFWGDLTGRGYGQIRALPWEIMKYAIDKDTTEEAPEKEEKKADGTQGSVLVRALEQYEQEQERRQTEWEDLKALLAHQKTLPSMRTIEQIIGLTGRGGATSYEEIITQLKHIQNDEKRKTAIDFMEPCKNKPKSFIETYLQISKWKARKEAAVNDGEGK